MVVVVINDVQQEPLDVEGDAGVGVMIFDQSAQFGIQGVRSATGVAL